MGRSYKNIPGQLPLLKPDTTWDAPSVSSMPSWANAKRIAIDVETHDPQLKTLGIGVRRGGYIVGISFAIEDGPSHYLPVRHAEDNLNEAHVFDYLRDQAKVFTGSLCGANLPYDLDYLAERGVVFRNVEFFRDCQVADPLINELHNSYSLQAIAERWNLQGKDETLLRDAASAWGVDPKKGIRELPARFVADYAIQDVNLPLQLLRLQERVIDDEGLWEVYNLESQILPILVKMRRRGVRIDLPKLQHVEDWAIQQETENLQKIFEETRVRIDVDQVWEAGALAKALEYIGVEIPLTAKTLKPSINQEMLDQIDHPVATYIKRARKVNKLRTTFAAATRRHMVGDRIHCTFNQLRKTDDGTGSSIGARYGRLSSTDPNLQNQPAREDFADMWRSIYVPDGDGLWGSCDYAAQEPRHVIHSAEVTGCAGAKAAGDLYREYPDTDSHDMMTRIIYGIPEGAPIDKKLRFNAKVTFLGLCYSMGGATLARNLGLPTKWIKSRDGSRFIEIAGPEAQSILDQFNRRMPFVRQLAKKCEKWAKKDGYIRTISGRRCRFPLDESGKGYDWCHKALNRRIQGSAADQTKYAMVQADAAGYRIQLQIHDEIAQTVESREHAEGLAKIMRECVELTIPSKVDVEIGPSWGEAA